MPKKTKPLKQKAKKKQPQRQKQSVNIKVNIDQSRRSNPRQASQASQGQRRGPFNAKSPVMSHVPLLTQIMPATGTGTTTTKNDDGVLKTTLDEVFKSRDQINDLTRRYADQSRYFHDLLDNQPHFDPEAQRHQLKLLLNEPEQQADIWNSIASSAKRLINYNLPQYSDNPPPAFQEAGPSGPGLVPPSRVRFDDEASQPPPEPEEQPPVPKAFQAPAEVVEGGAEALVPAQPEAQPKEAKAEAEAEPAQPEAQEEEPNYKPYKPITSKQRSYRNYINFAMDNNMVNRTPELDKEFESYKKIVGKQVPTKAEIAMKKRFENEFKGALISDKAKADYDKVPARPRKQ